jgi:hypothetical protein
VAPEGVDALHLVRPDRADALGLVADLLAGTAPATRVVLRSEQDPEYDGSDGWAMRAERAVHDSGRAWTNRAFLEESRPTFA